VGLPRKFCGQVEFWKTKLVSPLPSFIRENEVGVCARGTFFLDICSSFASKALELTIMHRVVFQFSKYLSVELESLG